MTRTTFGRVADAYDRLRPAYAHEAIELVVWELELSANSVVLDLAAGTGILTRALAPHVGHVIAVEPDDGMRSLIDGDARAGSAEQIPVDDASVDAVVVGDAFIWFDTARALTEIERVLRPGGGLALLWRDWYQREDPPLPAAVVDELTAVYERIRGAAPPPGAAWREAIPFALERASFTETFVVSGRDLAGLELTRSSPAALGDAEREGLAARIYPLMADEYTVSVVTDVDWTRLP
jgi:ubiquinone/menaquinone biosynthesis C-methylase UbiE